MSINPEATGTSDEFRNMVNAMTNDMLVCTVAAITIVLDQIVPNAEQAITAIATSLMDALAEGTNEQGDESATN